MNERLTELYRASRPKEALASQDEYKSANALLGSEVAKFAELIVRECATHLHRRGVEGFGILEERNLKEHFGIEPSPKLGPGVNFRPTWPDEE